MAKHNGNRNKTGTTCKNCGQFISLAEDSLGGRIKFLRLGKGLTLRGLADKLKISPTTVMRAEKNKEPHLEKVKIMAKFFKVSLDYLVYGENKNA